MRGRLWKLGWALPAAVAALALAVAGCSGGSSGSPTPNANPPVNGTAVLSVTTGSVPIPAAGGVSASFITGPGAAPDTAVTVSASTTAPANGLAPSAVRRAASTSGAVPFYYVTFSVSAPTPASVFVSQVLALASPPAGVTFYEEFDDTTGAPGSKLLTAPAGTVAGNAVTFTPVWPSGSTFVPGHTYTAMFYDVPGIASPTPAASGSPTAAPSGASPSPAPTITTPPPGGPTPTPTPTPTPAPTTASTAFTAGVAQTIAIPPAGESTGTIALEFTSNTTVTLTSVPGLPSGVPSPTTGGVVFFAESITASPAAAVASQSCGTGCSQPIPFTLYPGLNTIASAGGHTFYVAECSPTACPVSPGDAVAEPLQGSAIVLTSGSFNDITDFSSTPIWFVFYYQ